MDDSRLGQARRRSRRARERSLALAAEARRRLSAPPGGGTGQRGRLWLNGRELGDRDARFAHLGGSYD